MLLYLLATMFAALVVLAWSVAHNDRATDFWTLWKLGVVVGAAATALTLVRIVDLDSKGNPFQVWPFAAFLLVYGFGFAALGLLGHTKRER